MGRTPQGMAVGTTHGARSMLDVCAIASTTACAIHCIAVPAALVLSPTLAALAGSESQFHAIMIWLAVPSSAVAATMGCRRHKDWRVLAGALAGIGTMTLALVLGHDVLGELGERMLTLAGAAMTTVAHWRNYRLCRIERCRHDECRDG